LLRYQQQQKKSTDEAQQSTYDGEDDYGRDQEDTRTVRDILWPSPYRLRGEKEPGLDLPKTYEEWKIILPEAWALYKWTWRGFMSSRGFIVVDPLDKVESEKEVQETMVKIAATKDEAMAQAKANAEFLKEEALSLKQQVQERTGIHTKEDLRRFAAEMMRLASECVSEFMKGYRKGRDDEVERMLTQYFEELEKEIKKPPRRRAKRRILNRMHPLIK
jgi:phage anti-repressor protein